MKECLGCGQIKNIQKGTRCAACVKKQQRLKKESEGTGVKVTEDSIQQPEKKWRSVSSHPQGGYMVTPGRCRVPGTQELQECLNPTCVFRA